MKTSQLNIIENQVSKFRQLIGVSDTEAVNLNSLLLKYNVLTIYRPLSESFCGMSLKSGEKRFMLINSNNPIGRQHFTIAHELYHLFIEDNPRPHICWLNSAKDDSEKYADYFAQIFLMPSNGVKQLIPNEEFLNGIISVGTALKIEHYFSVSHQAAVNRLSDLKLINRDQRNYLLSLSVKKTAREFGYNTSLYDSGNKGLVIGDFGEKAKNLFDAEKISAGHYIELMNKIGIDGCED